MIIEQLSNRMHIMVNLSYSWISFTYNHYIPLSSFWLIMQSSYCLTLTFCENIHAIIVSFFFRLRPGQQRCFESWKIGSEVSNVYFMYIFMLSYTYSRRSFICMFHLGLFYCKHIFTVCMYVCIFAVWSWAWPLKLLTVSHFSTASRI